MTPRKTGVNLAFPQYKAFGRADVYEFPDTYVFIVNWTYEQLPFVHASVYFFAQSMRRTLENEHQIIVVRRDAVVHHHEWEYVPMPGE